MKKLFGIIFLALIVVMPAFSQLRMNGWGRAVWVPLFYDQQDWRSTVQSSYGDEPDIEFMFSASSAFVGVDVGVIVQAQQFNQIGNAKIWYRPNNFFKLHVGLGRVTTLRGKVESSTGAYAYARGRVTGLTLPSGKNEPILSIGDGDGIFSRFNLSKMGAIVEITPVQGLFIGAAVAPEFTLNSGLLAEDVYKGVHAAIGYEIKGLGLFRLGFVGGGSETDPQGKVGNAAQNWDFSYDRRVEAAFAITGIPKFVMDMGLKYSLERYPGVLDQPGFSLENPLYIALGAVYSGFDKLKIGFAVDGHFLGKADSSEDNRPNGTLASTSAPQIAFNIYPSYVLKNWELGVDFTYGMQFGEEKGQNDKKMLGFGLYGQRQVNHGNIRIGAYANVPMNEDQKTHEGLNWGLSFPVWLTYSF